MTKSDSLFNKFPTHPQEAPKCLGFELIPKPLYGENEFRLFGIFFQFLAQAGDMQRPPCGCTCRHCIPKPAFNNSSRESVAPRCSMKYRRSWNSRADKFTTSPFRVASVPQGPHEWNRNQNPPVCTTGRLGRTPEERFHAGHELQHIEWFRDVIIGARFSGR